MIARALILVAGPSGAGKTTFIERLLGASRLAVIAVRCVRDDRLRSPKETALRNHPELRRYRQAGASGAAGYRFPSSHADGEALYVTRFMEQYSEAVLLEGEDAPIEHVDLKVFVAPVSSHPGTTILVRQKRDRAEGRETAIRWLESLSSQPGGVEKLIFREFGIERPFLGNLTSDSFEDLRREIHSYCEKLRGEPPPEPTEHWAIAPGYKGIESAQLVVINARNDVEHGCADRMLKEIDRLRKDRDVFDDVLGYRGSRVPITTVVANLSDPGDAAVRKALARVKRVIVKVRGG